MSNSRKWKLVILVSLVVMIGIGSFGWVNKDISGREKDYKMLIGNMDDSLETLRNGQDSSDSLNSAKEKYEGLFENEIDSNLDSSISDSFDSLINEKESAKTSQMISLRGYISRAGNQAGISLPLTYRFSSLIILTLTVLASLVSTVFCKFFVDWDYLRDARGKVEEIREDIEELRRKKGKKAHKLDLKSEKMDDARGKLWGASIEQAALYLVFLVVLIPFFKFTFGGWTVVWFPFDWFTASGFQSLLGVSMNYMGWHVLTFLGFSFLWRKVFLSKEEKMIQ